MNIVLTHRFDEPVVHSNGNIGMKCHWCPVVWWADRHRPKSECKPQKRK